MLKKISVLLLSLGLISHAFACSGTENAYELHVTNNTKQSIYMAVAWTSGLHGSVPDRVTLTPNGGSGMIDLCFNDEDAYMLVNVGPYAVVFDHHKTDSGPIFSFGADSQPGHPLNKVKLFSVEGQWSSARYPIYIFGPTGGSYTFTPSSNFGGTASDKGEYMRNCSNYYTNDGDCRIITYFTINTLPPTPDQPK